MPRLFGLVAALSVTAVNAQSTVPGELRSFSDDQRAAICGVGMANAGMDYVEKHQPKSRDEVGNAALLFVIATYWMDTTTLDGDASVNLGERIPQKQWQGIIEFCTKQGMENYQQLPKAKQEAIRDLGLRQVREALGK